jgi:hypothetical protein
MKEIIFDMNIFGLFSFITSVIYYFSPIQFIYNLNQKLLDEYYVSYFSLGCLYFNGLFFFFYSVAMKEEKKIVPMEFCNLIGALICFIYTFYYIKAIYEGIKRIIYFLLFILGSFIAIFLELVIINLCRKKNHTLLKRIFFYFLSIFNIMMYFPIGFNLYKIFKNQFPEKIVFNSSLFGFLNCFSWLIFGIVNTFIEKGDSIHIIISNSLGLIICIFQMYLYIQFLKNLPQEETNDQNEKLIKRKINQEQENPEDSVPEILQVII